MCSIEISCITVITSYSYNKTRFRHWCILFSIDHTNTNWDEQFFAPFCWCYFLHSLCVLHSPSQHSLERWSSNAPSGTKAFLWFGDLDTVLVWWFGHGSGLVIWTRFWFGDLDTVLVWWFGHSSGLVIWTQFWFGDLDTVLVWRFGHSSGLVIWTQFLFGDLDTVLVWRFGHSSGLVIWTQLEFGDLDTEFGDLDTVLVWWFGQFWFGDLNTVRVWWFGHRVLWFGQSSGLMIWTHFWFGDLDTEFGDLDTVLVWWFGHSCAAAHQWLLLH